MNREESSYLQLAKSKAFAEIVNHIKGEISAGEYIFKFTDLILLYEKRFEALNPIDATL